MEKGTGSAHSHRGRGVQNAIEMDQGETCGRVTRAWKTGFRSSPQRYIRGSPQCYDRSHLWQSQRAIARGGCLGWCDRGATSP